MGERQLHSGRIETGIIAASELLVIDSTSAPDLRGERLGHFEIIPDGSVLLGDGTILWVGPTSALRTVVPTGQSFPCIDARGLTVTPGLIDAHSHLVFGGTREDEFDARIRGKGYLEIAQAGGGIKRTVQLTRAASESELFALGRERLQEILSLGITTLEVKSGYGLDQETEFKMLRVARELAEAQPVEIVTTFLGAHEIPPGIPKESYVNEIEQVMLPEVVRQDLAEFCDIFVEQGVYTPDDAVRILGKAREYGLKAKIHADQMSDSDGAALAVSLQAISADHLNYTNPEGQAALAASRCIGVLLPGSDFFLGLPHYPPARKMIEAGVAVALATDFNPGSCMTYNLPLIMTVACTQMRMSPTEVFGAVTLNAARALDRSETIGSLAPGKQADLVLFSCPNHKLISYHFGKNHVHTVIKKGKVVYGPSRLLAYNDMLQQLNHPTHGDE
ncbi:imidazolonepropionase [bacterium]|nr:imidazolonepropionase [bacterium]